jgi:hypothetical protein
MSDPSAAANEEEAPVYVNSKQFHRIMQRRIQREKWRNYFTRTKVHFAMPSQELVATFEQI